MYNYKAVRDTVVRVPAKGGYKDVFLPEGKVYSSAEPFDALGRDLIALKDVGPEAPVQKTATAKRTYRRKA